MINSVYNYYAAQYGHREYSKYDTHSKAQLKSTFGRLQKINSQTPSYKIDFSDAALKYAIDLKENARELSQIADELSDESTDSITYKRSATSSSARRSSMPNISEILVCRIMNRLKLPFHSLPVHRQTPATSYSQILSRLQQVSTHLICRCRI